MPWALPIQGFRIRRFDQPQIENNISTFTTADFQPQMENTAADAQLTESADAKGQLK